MLLAVMSLASSRHKQIYNKNAPVFDRGIFVIN